MKRFFKKIAQIPSWLKSRFQERFGKKYEIIFADEANIRVGEKRGVNLILSPKFYWVRIEELGVKYAFQAREYAPSLFEGSIDEGEYSYKAFKKEGKFQLFAYDVKAILQSLEKLGLHMGNVRGVYFAQSEFENYPQNIKIDEKSALVNKNGKIIKIPIELAENCTEMKKALREIKLSNHKINLGKFNRFYETKGAFKGILWLLLILIGLFGAELFYLNRTINSLEADKERIFSDYALPKSQLQLNSMFKQYDKINSSQSALRRALGELLKFKLQEGEVLKHIELDTTSLSATLRLLGKNRENALRAYLSGKFTIEELKTEGADTKIKMKL